LPSGNAENLVLLGRADLQEGLCYTGSEFRAPKARVINPLNAELNPIYHLLALLEAHRILHVSKIRVKNNIFGSRRNETLETQYKKSSPVTGLEWPRGFQEVKVPRFHDNDTGWW